MTGAQQPKPLLRFDSFVLDRHNRTLRRGGTEVELGSRYFDALVLMVEQNGELISKDRFMEAVWAGIPVTDEALTQCIRTLRRALGDDASQPRFIQTVPKHGYRFLAVIEAVHAEEKTVKPAKNPVSSLSTSEASRLAGVSTVGGVTAGVIGGLFYGIVATSGGAASIVTLLILTTALSLLGGAGIGAGMGLAEIWRPGRSWALPLGGAAGGALIGALGSTLGLFGLQALTGAKASGVTGIYEGMMLGLACGLAIVLARQLSGYALPLLAALTIGAIAGGLIALSGGHLFAATLSTFENRFPASQIDMARLAMLFGEDGFFMFTILGSAMLEGAVFVSAITLAIILADRRRA